MGRPAFLPWLGAAAMPAASNQTGPCIPSGWAFVQIVQVFRLLCR